MATTTIGDLPPPSPSPGDAWWHSGEGQLYIWFQDATSSQWVAASNQRGSGAGGYFGSIIHVADNPPVGPRVGDAWWDSSIGQLYIWTDDGTSQQWVIAINQPGPQGPPGPPGTSFFPGGPSGPALPTPIPIVDMPTWLNPEATWDQLYDNVQVQLPGVTADNVQMQSWNTVYDFFISTTYRREHVFWRMDPGVVTLSFDPWDTHWRVFRFLEFKGIRNIKFEPPGRIRDLTWPLPDTTRQGEVLFALRPESINTPLGDDFWAMWFDPIVAGVLGRLYWQPGKPWTDMNMGRIQLATYRVGVAQARAHVQSGFITDGAFWRFPYFGTGHAKSGGWGGPG